MTISNMSEHEIRTALTYIDAQNRDVWIKVGTALKTEFGESGFALFDEWSSQASNYRLNDAKTAFKSFQIGKSNIGYLINQAKQNGWQREKPQGLDPDEIRQREERNAQIAKQAEIERQEKAFQAALFAQNVWKNAKTADKNHPYLQRKGITHPAVLDAIRQDKEALIIPLKNHGEIVGIQKIFADGNKRFNRDIEKKGSAFVIGNRDEMHHGFLLAEGFATAATLYQATGKPVVVAFDAGNLQSVAQNLKAFVEKHHTPVLICADKDDSQTGETKAMLAKKVLGDYAQVVLPYFTADEIQKFQAAHNGKTPTDFNDLQTIGGVERVKETLSGSLNVVENAINQSQVSDIMEDNFEKDSNDDNRTNRTNPQTATSEISLSENADRAGISGNGSRFSSSNENGERIFSQLSTLSTTESTSGRIESTGAVMPRPERSAWGDFPPLIRNGSLEEMKSHPDYIAAKSGDFSAAVKMVEELINPETLQQINQMVGDKKPIVIAVQAEESAGRNKIPIMLATYIAEHNQWDLDEKIFQADHVGRTDTDSSFRLAFNPIFRGEVEKDRNYLIVDDNSTMGGTIASLKGYIENRGGKVLGAVVLSARETTLNIVPTQKQFNHIQQKFGNEPNHYWEKEFGYGIDKLTRSEAGIIRTSPTFELIKKRIDHARERVQALINAKEKDNPNPDEIPRPPQGGFVLSVENSNTNNRQPENHPAKEMIMAEQDKLTPSAPLEKHTFTPDTWQPETPTFENRIDFADDRQMVMNEVERAKSPEMTHQEKVQAAFEILQNQYHGYRFHPDNNRLEIENSPTKEAIHLDDNKLIYTAEHKGARQTIGDIDIKDLSPEYLALSIENRRLSYQQELLQNGFPNETKRQALDQKADQLDESVRLAKRQTELLSPPDAPPYQLSERYLAVKRQFIDNATHYGEKTNTGLKARVDYVDAQNGKTVLFSDKGNKLTTAIKTPDEQQIQDMLTLAQSKGWKSIKVSGSRDFKQQVYVLAQSQGIAVKGYTPTAEDLARVEQLREKNSTNRIEENKHIQQKGSTKEPTAEKGGISLSEQRQPENKTEQQYDNRALQEAKKEQGMAYAVAEKINNQSLSDTYTDGSNRVPDEVMKATTDIKNQSDVGVGKAKAVSPLQRAKQRYQEKFAALSESDKAKHVVYEQDMMKILNNGKLSRQQENTIMTNFYHNAADKIQNGQSQLPTAVGLENIKTNLQQTTEYRTRTEEHEMER